MKISEFSVDNALKMMRGGEILIMHVSWFSPSRTGYQGIDLDSLYPDCTFVLVSADINKHWRDPKSLFGVVIDTEGRLDRLTTIERAGWLDRE